MMREDPGIRIQLEVAARLIAPHAFHALAKNKADVHAAGQVEAAMQKAEGILAVLALQHGLTLQPKLRELSPGANQRLREALRAQAAAEQANAAHAYAHAIEQYAALRLPQPEAEAHG